MTPFNSDIPVTYMKVNFYIRILSWWQKEKISNTILSSNKQKASHCTITSLHAPCNMKTTA